MKINHEDFLVNNKTEDSIYYTIVGEEDFLDSDGNGIISDPTSDKIFAKAINNKKPRDLIKNSSNLNKMSYRFFIKTNPESQLFNPKQLYTVSDPNRLGFVDSKCKDGWSFKEVSRSAFDKYLLFLKTQSVKWLKEAQREIK
jgi:hypothetical protein